MASDPSPADRVGASVGIRPQRTADGAAVAALLEVAFAEEPEVVALERALDARADSRGFVAVLSDRVVGHVRLTRGWVDAPDRLVEVEVLSPLSVLPARQGQGLGGALVAYALDAARAADTPMVLLEGDPGYYRRLGWAPAAQVGVLPPSDRIPASACQVVTLPAYRPWMRGRLVYADTFWAHDCVGLRGDALASFAATP